MKYNTFLDIQHTYPFSDMEVLAGQGGLTAAIRCAGVLDAPDSVKYVRAGEFVLTTGYIFINNPNVLMEIIRELHNRHAAALGIKMFRYIQDIPEECKALANQYDLPLIFIPSKFTWNDILNPLILNISMFSDSTTSFINVYSRLLRSIQKSQSVPDLLSSASTILGHPITLVNTEKKSFLNYPTDFECPLTLDDTFFREAVREEYYLGDETSLFYYRKNDARTHMLISTLSIDEYQMLILWNAPDIKDNGNLNMLIYATLLISESVFDMRKRQKDLIHKKNFLLDNLFCGDAHASKEEAVALQIDPWMRYSPVLAQFVSSCSQNYQDISIYNPKVHSCFDQLCQKYNIHSSIGQDGLFRFLIPTNSLWDTWHDIVTYSRQYGKRIQSVLQAAFPDRVIHILIGQAALDWEDIPVKYRDTLALMKTMKDKTSLYHPALMHIHDIGASFLLLQPKIYDRLPEFYREFFSPLSQADTTMQDNILETLKVYVECGFNYREAARILNVHHNTIRYRLEQFSDITGLEITDQDDLLTILICLQYHNLRKKE